MTNLKSSNSFKTTFTEEQQEQIELGKKANLDVSIYANPKYNWAQMREIRKGLASRLDVSEYADPSYPAELMNAIRIGLIYSLH